MPAATKKRPMVEDPEDDMEESGEDEVREGSASGKGRRARKGKKSCSCNDCKSGKACPCNDSMKNDGCGSPRKPRTDALTPQEYLDACDLGIQRRSRSYIRARLDAAKRLDLRSSKPCGASHIPSGHQCTKGTGAQSSATPTKQQQKAKAKKEFKAIVNPQNFKEIQAGRAWSAKKASTKGTARKIMRAGEVAARVGANVAIAGGIAQAAFGQKAGSLNKGIGMAHLGMAAHRVASASKARRAGNRELANEFLKSAGRQAAVGGLNMAAAKFTETVTNAARAKAGRRTSTGTGEAPPPKRNYKGDPFKDLGVNAKMSDDEIKKAWKTAARKHHPDMGGNTEDMKRVNTAYEEIMRRRGRKDSSIWMDGFSPEDILS